MTQPISSNSSALEKGPIVSDPSRKRGRDGCGRLVEEVQEDGPDGIDVHMRAISVRLGTIHNATSRETKIAAISDLAPHISALRSFSMRGEEGQLESVQRRRRQAENDEGKVCRCVEATVSLLHDVERIEQSIADEERAASLKETMAQAIQQAQHSADPVGALATAYQTTQEFLVADARFYPFLRDAARLMSSLRNRPEVVKSLILPLLQKVLLEDLEHGGISPREGSLYIGRLLFAVDNNLVDTIPTSFDESFKTIDNIVLHALGAMKTGFRSRPIMAGVFLYQPGSLKSTLLPNQIATALVRPDGTLNLGIIDLVKKNYLSTRKERDSAERHIVSVLREFEANEQLCRLLESVPVPTLPSSRGLVNATLLRPYDAPVFEADVRIAILASLLTWWRQGLENCFVAMNAIRLQGCATELLLEDFRELLATGGTLTRILGGEQVVLHGQEWPANKVGGRSFSRNIVGRLFSVEPIRNACQELGCETEKNFIDAVDRAWKGSRVTLLNIFEELRAEHGKSQIDLRRACWVAESPEQNLLHRLWENAMGSMFFAPIHGVTTKNHDCSEKYLEAIRFSWFLASIKIGLTEPSTSPQLFSTSLGRLRACLVPQVVRDERLAWALYEDREGTLVPFKDREEFAVFLRTAFMEWFGQLEQSVSEELRQRAEAFHPMRLIEFFENELRNRVPECECFSAFDTLCYSMQGVREVIDVERPECQRLETVQPFSNSQLPIRSKVQLFLQNLDQIRSEFGPYPDLQIPVKASDHIFGLLPNHPSITKTTKLSSDIVDQAEEFARKVSESVRDFSEMQEKISDIVKRHLWETRWTEIDKIFDEIIASVTAQIAVKNTTPSSSLQCDVGSFLSILWSAIEEISVRYGHKKPTRKERFLLNALVELFPNYKDQFFHFADTGWKPMVGNKNEAVHFCLWKNPLGDWTVLCLPESGDTFEAGGRDAERFFNTMRLEPHGGTSASLISKIHNKTRVCGNRKTAQRLQKIERQFAEKYRALEEESRQLPEFLLSQLTPDLDGTTPLGSPQTEQLPIQQVPPKLESALKECRALRQQYQRIIQDRATKPDSLPQAYRYRQWFPESKVAQFLC